MGSIDIVKPVNERGSAYGKNFVHLLPTEIDRCLTPLVPPTKTNIFAIAGPNIRPGSKGKPYSEAHFEHLFQVPCTAFRKAKLVSDPNKSVTFHTGNWGCGAFGGGLKMVYLMTLLDAMLTLDERDELVIYPMDSQMQLLVSDVKDDLNQFCQVNPDLTLNQLLAMEEVKQKKFDAIRAELSKLNPAKLELKVSEFIKANKKNSVVFEELFYKELPSLLLTHRDLTVGEFLVKLREDALTLGLVYNESDNS
jgi:hypothetical protein